jgi:hypothetical protein
LRAASEFRPSNVDRRLLALYDSGDDLKKTPEKQRPSLYLFRDCLQQRKLAGANALVLYGDADSGRCVRQLENVLSIS